MKYLVLILSAMKTSQGTFINHCFLFLFAFSIPSQLFLIWGCKLTLCIITYARGLMEQINFPPFVNGGGRKLGTTSRTSHMTHVINTATLNDQAMQTNCLGHCKRKSEGTPLHSKMIGHCKLFTREIGRASCRERV